MEKQRRLERRKRDLAFFKEMEQNILQSLARGELIPGIPLSETKKEGPPKEPRPVQRVRTISSMDNLLLAELRDDSSVRRQEMSLRTSVQSVSSSSSQIPNSTDKSGRPPLPTGPSARRTHRPVESTEVSKDHSKRSSDNDLTDPEIAREDAELAGESLLDAPIQSECDLSELRVMTTTSPPLGHTRRNTGGTIYLKTTMTNPDINATIKCVCGVYRAHIVQAAGRKCSRSPVSVIGSPMDIEVFRDDYESPRRRQKEPKIPKLSDVLAFYQEFYRRSQMEHDTIITSLIYVERLIKASNGILSPMPENWRSILFSCMVLASKVWDDLSMWNIDFSNVSASSAGLSSFTLQRINQLELALLKNLNFDVKVPASEYAKYYFLIRTMLLRSGLVQEVEKPLGKQDAFNTLEAKTSRYQSKNVALAVRDRRSKSMDDNFWVWLAKGVSKKGPVLGDSVCLEQLVG